MSIEGKMIGGVEVTPEVIAGLFWDMASDEQADFFAALHRTAGLQLCFQMASVVSELVERADRGDHDGADGFRTMFNHAEDYPEAAADWRAMRARQAIDKVARA